MEKEQLISIVTAAQNGDNDALNTLFNTFYNDFYYFALKTVKDENTALDVTQESFIEIINTLDKLKEPAAFVTWAKKITYHQCTRYFRKKKDVIVDEDEDSNTIFDHSEDDGSEFIPDEVVENDEFKKTIISMVDQLPEAQRTATILRYFDELSVKEIAEIQGVSEGTIKSRLNYARNSIKKSVEEFQKNNGFALYSISCAPLFKWAYDGSFTAAMPTDTAKTLADGISTSTGRPVTLVDTAKGKTLDEKFAALPLYAKIIACIAAAAITIGGIASVVIPKLPKNNIPDNNQNYASSNDDTVSFPNSQNNQNNALNGTNSEKTYKEMIGEFVSSDLNTFELNVGDEHAPNARVWLQGGSGSTYSSNEKVVTVTAGGKVTAVGEGTAFVVITANSGSSMYAVYRYDVFDEPAEPDLSNLPDVEGVDFAYEIENFASTALNTYTLEISDTHSPTAALWAQSGGKCYTSDSSVVRVASNGTVTAVGKGTAFVIIQSGVSNSMFQMYKYIIK